MGPRRAYPITVPYPPGERTHWRDVCVPLVDVAQRVLPGSLDVAEREPELAADQQDLATTVDTGGIVAFQVKCIEVDASAPAGLLHLPVRTLSRSPRAWLAVFVRRPGRDVMSPCLLIPATDIPNLANTVTDGYLHITVNPRRLAALEQYAHALDALPAALESIAARSEGPTTSG